MSNGVLRRVGIVGLGKMGHPIARHLRAGGFAARGWDVDAAARARAAASGIALAGSIKELTAASDFVIALVGFDTEVEEVLCGAGGVAAAARPGLIVGVASTVAPHTMKRLAARLAQTGITLLDMPLCRGEAAAEAGKLQIMVGGDAAGFAAVKPALQCFADAIFHLGALGAGQTGKLVNNLILWACISANHEGLKLAERLGVAIEPLRQALLASSAANWALESRVEERPMPWAEKDMMIVLKEADRVRLSLPLSGALKEAVKAVKIERGWPTPQEPED
ncbi:MAG TPA: NAD(P)-dependent oxidoreductase [Stellaceae bacterium]|nr:NAD(P)-dependent oxidoreductase [Stellaceae bacterium]